LIETMGMEICTRKNNARFEKTAVVNAFSLESLSYDTFNQLPKFCAYY